MKHLMKVDVKGFIAIMRRATHSRFSTVLMHNRMLLQCYNLDIDSDVGFHYILHIPDPDEYESEFYNETIMLTPSEVLAAYNGGHKLLGEKKKEAGAKAKEANEELYFSVKKDHAELKFLFYLKDELVTSEMCEIKYPIDMTSVDVENIQHSYDQILSRIKPGGACLVFDGLRYGLQEKAYECSEIYYFIVKYGKKKIRVPLIRSMFGGIKEVDRFLISIQESSLGDDIFIYALQFMKKGIVEQFWGYLLNY